LFEFLLSAFVFIPIACQIVRFWSRLTMWGIRHSRKTILRLQRLNFAAAFAEQE
jgi:hypothetical protein